jgi:hypothetical protein
MLEGCPPVSVCDFIVCRGRDGSAVYGFGSAGRFGGTEGVGNGSDGFSSC